MGRNNKDFFGGSGLGGLFTDLPPFPSIHPDPQGPAQRVKVTPSEKDANTHGVESYSFDAQIGTTKKDVGKHIAGAIKSGLPKPAKVEFNKE